MGTYRRLGWALLISLLGHAVLWHYVAPPETVRPVTRFEVELTVPPAPKSAPAAEEKPPVEIPEPEPPEAPEAVAEAPDVEPVREEPASTPSTSDGPASAPLDLSLPSDWEQIVREVNVPDDRLAFTPGLGRALQAREADIRRVRLVQQRSGASYGVADEAYSRSGPLGEELKRDGGCVTLVEDRQVEEGQRWWANTCTETRRNPFTLPVVEYDALGRAVVE